MEINLRDPKTYGMGVVGGAAVLIVGNYILPVTSSLLKFDFMSKVLFLGLTPNALVASGVGFLAGMWLNSKIFK